MTVGFETWVPKTCSTVFIVKNIAPERKRIKIFHYPIDNGCERDLMTIPQVSEADIKHSLLKGELKTKFETNEAIVTRSNIDLIQFDDCQKAWLQSYGVIDGLEGGGGGSTTVPFMFKQGMELVGVIDGVNRLFTTTEIFINGTWGSNIFKIEIIHNGRSLVEGFDYILAEGGGVGTGYNTIMLKFTPSDRSVIRADYVVKA
jgi:hypothetical protein